MTATARDGSDAAATSDAATTSEAPAWHAWLLLVYPRRILASLERVRRAGVPVDGGLPNLWQLELGVLRMWHRLIFRADTVGTSPGGRVRPTWRARLLANRALRLPFLIAERAVAPLDFTGLVSPPERVIRHLLAAHHDGNQFAFDLELLSCHDGGLDALAREVAAFFAADERRVHWLRDLTVFEGYHENLAAAVDAVRSRGLELTAEDAANADISFRGYLSWCARQPSTPRETLREWRAGRFRFAPEVNA